MCYTDEQGVENELCSPCLVGEPWDALREQLGSSFVSGKRRTVPVVKYGKWLSSTLMATVFRILLKVSAKLILSPCHAASIQITSPSGCECGN